jgi:hypothetical protein
MEYQVWVNYGYGEGWEHELTEDTSRKAREQIRTYRKNGIYVPMKIKIAYPQPETQVN